MGAAMKTINDQLKSDTPDRVKIGAAADAISAGAPLVAGWFPMGSDAASGVETDALDHVWKDQAKFKALSERLIAESKNLLAAVSTSEPASLKPQVKAVGEVCSTCHRSFRAE